MLMRNLMTNFFGKGWLALVQLLFVPIYTKILGIEAYGLVGFFALLIVIGSLFDSGLGSYLNREVARFSALGRDAGEFHSLVRTIEIPFVLLCLGIGGAIALSSGWITCHWLKLSQLDPTVAKYSISLMGASFAFQLPISLYQNALQGMQKQIMPNILAAIFATIKAVGAVAVLYWIAPSPIVFFAWQVLVNFFHALLMRELLLKNLPLSLERAKFDKKYLFEGKKFASEVTLLTILGVLITYLDKAVLSKMLPLEEFGYYSVAAAAANGLTLVIHPVFFVLFPLFAQVIVRKDEEGLLSLYRKSTQIMMIFLLPLAFLLIFFPVEILQLWTANDLIVSKSSQITLLLGVGSALNGLAHLPYILQLASGELKAAFFQRIITLVFMIPLLLFLVKGWGAEGAALVWILSSLFSLLYSSHVVHKQFLSKAGKSWYLFDGVIPLLGFFLVAAVGKGCLPENLSKPALFGYLLFLLGAIFLTGILLSSFPRLWLREKLKNLRGAA
jgi:O-antigen/teichoic acid export membrane protein